jgi:hypothetical protein
MAQRTRTTYEELETVAIPEDVPELGLEAGTTGTIVTVYEDGRKLLVEIGREDGTSIGLVDLEVGEDGSLRPTSSTPFSSR